MLKRKIILQILIVLLIQCILGATAFGDSIMTDAGQAIGAVIGYQYPWGTDNTVEEQLVPDPPQGLSNADLDITLEHYGVSVSASLTSTFSEDQVTADGLSTTSAYWGDQPVFDGDHPDDANDVHGGAGPTFRLYFTEGASPVYVSITGLFNINLDGYASLNPMETRVSMTLSDGSGIIWHKSLDGTDAQTSKIVGYGLWLETGQNYQFQAFVEAATHASDEHPALHSRTASFSLYVTWEPGCVVPDVFGLTEADAEATIEAAGLVKGVVTYEPSDIIEACHVSSQSPDSGTTVMCGSAVDLVISAASVPDVLGMTEADAEIALNIAGLVKGVVTHDYSDTVDAGLVMDQNPNAETSVVCGSAVDLVISDGPSGGGGGEMPLLPDLEGEFGRVKLPAPVTPGDTIRAKIIVTNNGFIAIARKQVIDIEFCLRPCDVIGGAEDICVMTLTNLSVSNLRPGKSRKFNARIIVPADIIGGEYRLRAKVDSSNHVIEWIEVNNTAISECFEVVGE